MQGATMSDRPGKQQPKESTHRIDAFGIWRESRSGVYKAIVVCATKKTALDPALAKTAHTCLDTRMYLITIYRYLNVASETPRTPGVSHSLCGRLVIESVYSLII